MKQKVAFITGVDISIKDLASKIKSIIGFNGEFVFNTDKPDGAMKKLTDVAKVNNLGWKHTVGIEKIYNWYCNIPNHIE